MPYKSKAQAAKFHIMEQRGEINHATVAEFDAASRGKDLPEHVRRQDPKAEARARKRRKPKKRETQ